MQMLEHDHSVPAPSSPTRLPVSTGCKFHDGRVSGGVCSGLLAARAPSPVPPLAISPSRIVVLRSAFHRVRSRGMAFASSSTTPAKLPFESGLHCLGSVSFGLEEGLNMPDESHTRQSLLCRTSKAHNLPILPPRAVVQYSSLRRVVFSKTGPTTLKCYGYIAYCHFLWKEVGCTSATNQVGLVWVNAPWQCLRGCEGDDHRRRSGFYSVGLRRSLHWTVGLAARISENFSVRPTGSLRRAISLTGASASYPEGLCTSWHRSKRPRLPATTSDPRIKSLKKKYRLD